MKHYVWDAMSRNPRLNAVECGALAAVVEARRHGIHNVIMTDDTGVIGVARTIDLEHAEVGVPLWAFGNGELATIEASDTLDAAELKMNSRGVDCLPVLGWEGLLIGVLTRGDIRRHLEHASADDPVCPDAGERCATCGATSDLATGSDAGVAFCRECLAHTRTP